MPMACHGMVHALQLWAVLFTVWFTTLVCGAIDTVCVWGEVWADMGLKLVHTGSTARKCFSLKFDLLPGVLCLDTLSRFSSL